MQVSLYWYNEYKNDDIGSFIMEINPEQGKKVSTYVDHSFFVVRGYTGEAEVSISRAFKEFKIQRSVYDYEIGSRVNEAENTPWKVFTPIRVAQPIETRPLNSETDPAKRRLNIEKRDRSHPLVLSLKEDKIDSSVMMNAKFRSLSPRKVARTEYIIHLNT
jgi:hypothetical protein